MNPDDFPSLSDPYPENDTRAPRRRRLRLAFRIAAAGVLLAAGSVVALAVAVRVCPFPKEKLTRFRASPEWFAADGERVGYALAPRDFLAFDRDAGAVSPWLAKATLAIEDRRFHEHAGVDWLRVARAAYDNTVSRRRVSGASTLTMQLCRLMDDRPRTWPVKLDEAWLALRLDRAMSKHAQMTLYLNRAPYGGNCVGVEAACLRYFGRSAKELTPGEAALIAGIPQSPERLRPDLHPDAALTRRNRVLLAMEDCGWINHEQRLTAQTEPLPEFVRRDSPAPAFPVRTAMKLKPAGGRLLLDAALQREASGLLDRALASCGPGIQGAAVILDLNTDAVVVRVGASPGRAADRVDHARRARSPGSALKPFAYALAFEDGTLAPDSVVSDGAESRFTWSPKNNDGRLRGEVTAAAALRESLNLPAIAVTRNAGLSRVVALAGACGVKIAPGAVERSGLSWIVGGGETTLESLVDAYATLGRGGIRKRARVFSDDPSDPGVRVLSAGTCALIDGCLGIGDERLPEGWEQTDESRRPWFMWKTGTSSGGRDAWAVGHNGRFAIGVWIGATAGTSREKVSSKKNAEPLLAELFSLPAIRVATQPTPSLPAPAKLPATVPVKPGLRILAPSDNARLLAVDGTVAVYPAADRPGKLWWFLDDAPLAAPALRPLLLGVGMHELRCVTESGEFAAVHVTVEPAD